MQNDATKKTKSAPRIILAVILLFLVIIIIAMFSQNKTKSITIKQIEINVKIATTSQERAKDLCCRDSLDQNSGMLFVYDQPGDYRFWMKDTRIPLDIYWIDSKKMIVHIEHAVQPNSYPQSFGTKIPAQYVLETNAGFAKKHSIKTGDEVIF